MLELQKCPQLRVLNMTNLTMKGCAIEAFCRVIRSNAFMVLEELYLNHCSFTQESLQHLACAMTDCPLQLLHTLSLEDNHLTAESMMTLSAMFQRSTLPSLRHLNLRKNKIGNKGIQPLNSNDEDGVLSQVEVLNLSENGISNDGAFILFDIIRRNQWSHLVDLNLEDNKITSVTAVQLRSLLEMDNKLEILRMSDMTRRRAAHPAEKDYELHFDQVDFIDFVVNDHLTSEGVLTPTALFVC